jgi:thermolysin
MFKPAARSIKTLVTYQASGAVQPPDSETLRGLRSVARGRMKIRWNTCTGTPRSIRGVLTEPADGSPEEMARQFLRQYREMFGLPEDLADLVYIRMSERRGIRHVTFRQVYQGVPVFGAELSVHIDQADRVQMVNGDYYPELTVEMAAEPISKTAAMYTVMSHLEVEGALPDDIRAEWVIFSRGDEAYRAYQVNLSCRVPLGNWVYFVDAVSGEILDGYNGMRFATGKGQVFNFNPKRDDDEVVMVQLFDLIGNRTLRGTYFQVLNDGGPEALASSDAHEFVYAPDEAHFDEPMVYYHLNLVAKFFRNLGHTNHVAPMLAHVHVPDPDSGNPHYDNAYYDPRKNAMFFGHGEVFHDLAWEAAVIYHEYTHAVVEAVQPLMVTHEASALHEGYADYFACSITNDPQIGEYVVGQSGRPNLRNLRHEKTYEEFTGFDVHSDGEIWGIACWKIREALGSRVADLLIYESLGFLAPQPTFLDASEGIIQADISLFSGEYAQELYDIFAEQKIVPGQPAGHTFTITASAGNGGHIEPSGEVMVTQGDDQAFVITPESGHVIKTVVVDGTARGKLSQYTFEGVEAPHTIEAGFEKSDTYEWIVIVPGATRWMTTGITISKGDLMSFSAHGSVVYNRRGNACGPGGTSWTDTRDKEDPLWNKPHGALIGKIGESSMPFFIGTTSTTTADRDGMLLFGVNDFWYQGNTGEFTVTVNVSRTG